MRQMNSRSAGGRWLAKATLVAGIIGATSLSARADDDATKILKAMSDYVGSQQSIAVTFDSDVEVVTSELQKIQFTGSGQVLLSRPDKVRMSRTGGYTDVELVFDGKTLSVLGKNVNAYVQAELAGSFDQMVDEIQGKFGSSLPGADLLLTHSYDELIAGVIVAEHIGQGVVGGVECEHLAFRNADTDWQIWIETGAKPIPRKYIITSKTLASAPQYTLTIREWKTDAPAAADAFVFTPPSGATKASLERLAEFDEIPPGVTAGAKK